MGRAIVTKGALVVGKAVTSKTVVNVAIVVRLWCSDRCRGRRTCRSASGVLARRCSHRQCVHQPAAAVGKAPVLTPIDHCRIASMWRQRLSAVDAARCAGARMARCDGGCLAARRWSAELTPNWGGRRCRVMLPKPQPNLPGSQNRPSRAPRANSPCRIALYPGRALFWSPRGARWDPGVRYRVDETFFTRWWGRVIRRSQILAEALFARSGWPCAPEGEARSGQIESP